MSAKLGGKTKKKYGKRGFLRLIRHVFRKTTPVSFRKTHFLQFYA